MVKLKNFSPIAMAVVLAILIVGAVIAIIVGYPSFMFVEYRVDEWNSCSNGLTTAVNGPEHIEQVSRFKEKAYLQEAEKSGRCVYRL